MQKLNYFLLGVFITSIFSLLFENLFFIILAIALFSYFIVVISLHFKSRSKKPTIKVKKSKDQISMDKLKKARQKEDDKKHTFINNQVAYISTIWELSQNQEKIFYTFIEKRAYSELYSKMTASLLPQLTKMIEECLKRDKKGCKREVNARINELVLVMKEEIKRKKVEKKENFETMRDVYDHLLLEVKS